MNIIIAGWIQKLKGAKDRLLRPGNFITEWLIIVIWGLWVGRAYLNTNPYIWPAGREMGIKLLTHNFWLNLRACGVCALWDGTINGGRPAFADLFGSQFHPLIAFFTIGWGIIVGARLSIVAIMILAGLAQWWIGKELKLGSIARTWSGLIAVVGGHIATQHYWGHIGIMLSYASCALAIAAALRLGQNPTRRNSIILAITGVLVLVSGQGYVQFGFLFWAPAGLLFFAGKNNQAKIIFREFSLAVVLSVLMIGILIVPIIHFSPNLTKDLADPLFSFTQPAEYIPLNLVIRDPAFYVTGDILGKQPTNDLLFIGWIPVLFAILSLRFVTEDDIPTIGFLGVGMLITFWVCGATPLRWLAAWNPYVVWVKYVFLIGGLVIPPLLGIAAFGLNSLLKANSSAIELRMSSEGKSYGLKFNPKWLLVIPLFWALQMSYGFVTIFMQPHDMTKMYTDYIWHYKTKTTEWVAPPGAEQDWIQAGLDQGFKMTGVPFSGSFWAGRDAPPQYLISVRGELISDKPFEQVDIFEGLPVYHISGNDYAYVTHGDGTTTPCEANAKGGFIIVNCTTERQGILTVVENSWDGWFAWLDGAPTEFFTLEHGNARWLGTNAPPGKHTYEFKYLPWDVAFGTLLSLFGIGLVIYFWVSSPKDNPLDMAE